MKKQQANIPGIRPGKQTAEYIERVITRLTVEVRSTAAICVVRPSSPPPSACRFNSVAQVDDRGGVALETVNQIEAPSSR